MYNNQFTTQHSYSLQLNPIQNFGVPSGHQDLPPHWNQHWGDINNVLRDVIYSLHNPNYETPGNYIVNVYSAGGWNNSMMSGLQNMVAHWLYFEGNKQQGQNFNVRAILEDALTLHVFLKFQADLNSWMVQRDYNFTYRFLGLGPEKDRYFQEQVAPWVAYTLQQRAQQNYPQQNYPQQNYPQQNYPHQHQMPPYNAPQQPPVSMGMGTPHHPTQPQQQPRPANGMQASRGSYGVKELVERRNQTQQQAAPTRPQQPAPQQAQQTQQPKNTGSLFEVSDIENVKMVRLCSNYGTFDLTQKVDGHLTYEEYQKGFNHIQETHQLRMELLDSEENVNSLAVKEELRKYADGRHSLGIALVRTQYNQSKQVIRNYERPFGTKNQDEMLKAVFTEKADAYVDVNATKAVIIDNREYLLYPSTNPFIRILVNNWRKKYPFTHNFGCDVEADEHHYYRLIQYHPSEPIFIEDVYLENPAMNKNEFDMSLHMPFKVYRPIDRITDRNDDLIERTPNPPIIVPEGEPEKLCVVENRRRLVTQSARQAVSVAKATCALVPDEKETISTDKHITATRYDVPKCLYLKTEEDKEFHQRFMNDIKSGALGTLDAIATRLKTSKHTNRMSTDYYDFLNGYLARRLFNIVNHTIGYNACILEGGFVEEWESIKKDIFVRIPAFLLDVWRRNETAYIREQFNYLTDIDFNHEAINEYLSSFAEQLPYPRDAETGELLIPVESHSDVEPTTVQMAEFFAIPEETFDDMSSKEYTEHVNNYKDAFSNAVTPVKFTLENTAVIVDKFVVYEVPYTINDLGILNSYTGDTKRAVHSDGHPLMGLVSTINAEAENVAGIKQQLLTKDGYTVDIIRSIGNDSLFSFVLREAE